MEKELRIDLENEFSLNGNEKMHKYLSEIDEESAAKIHKNDTQQNSLTRITLHADNLNTGGKVEGLTSTSQIIDLSSGDTLHVEFNSSGSGAADYYNGAAYSCFGGYLLG